MKFLKSTHQPDASRGEFMGNGRRNEVWESGVSVQRFREGPDGISAEARRRVALAFRQPKNHFGASKLYDEAQTHETLQAAGIPVAHATYRLAPDNGGVFCTDLTRGGKNFVFSDTNRTSQDGEWKAALESKEEVPAPNCEQALDSLVSIAMQCAGINREIMLADAFYFIIDKRTRFINVVIGDYKHVIRGQSDPDFILKNNLDVARQAAVSKHDVFGVSVEKINAWFDRKEEAIVGGAAA